MPHSSDQQRIVRCDDVMMDWLVESVIIYSMDRTTTSANIVKIRPRNGEWRMDSRVTGTRYSGTVGRSGGHAGHLYPVSERRTGGLWSTRYLLR